MTRKSYVLASILTTAFATSAAAAPEPFVAGNAAATTGDHANAAMAFEHALDLHGWSAGALFDLGNAYASSGRPGSAILAYERASILAPRDHAIRANLEHVRESAGVTAAAPSTMRAALATLSSDEWTWIAIAAAILACTGVVAFAWSLRGRTARFLAIAGISASAFAMTAATAVAPPTTRPSSYTVKLRGSLLRRLRRPRSPHQKVRTCASSNVGATLSTSATATARAGCPPRRWNVSSPPIDTPRTLEPARRPRCHAAMRLALVEDDERIGEFVYKGLTQDGHIVDWARTGIDGLAQLTSTTYDAAVIDVMLPAKSGLDVIREVRKHKLTTPIIILSARDSVDDRIAGLEAGADDYLTKPFSFAELVARLHALVRRATASPTSFALTYADVTLDLRTRRVERGGKQIHLQAKEFVLLEYLMRNPERVLSKTMILEHVWEYGFDPQTNVVDVLVSRLRAKLDREFSTKLIHTLRGAGYVLRSEAE